MAEELSVESLTRGEPAMIMQAEEPRILITGLHGDETLAARTVHRLYGERPEYAQYVDYFCGNPEAAALGERFVGLDMNRAFSQGPTVEDGMPALRVWQRAQALKGLIGTRDYDYVLDLHTSDTQTEGFFLIDHRNPVVEEIIAMSDVKHIAVLPHRMIGSTLMGAVPRAVAIEYARADEGLDEEECLMLIERLLSGETNGQPRLREFFNVTREITKDSGKDPGADAPNFVRCNQGYYPILNGTDDNPRSYRNSPGNLICFAADRVEIARL